MRVAILFLFLQIWHVYSIDMLCEYDRIMKYSYSAINENVRICNVISFFNDDRRAVVTKVNEFISSNLDTLKLEYFDQSDLSNITTLNIINQNVLYFPKNIDFFFFNLEILTIKNSSLKVITQEDIKVFPNLVELDVSFNNLLFLESFLFDFNQKVKSVNFGFNKNLKHIGETLLSPLRELKDLDMRQTGCINYIASKKTDWQIINRENTHKEEWTKDSYEFMQTKFRRMCPPLNFRKRSEDFEDEVESLKKQIKFLQNCDTNLNSLSRNFHFAQKNFKPLGFDEKQRDKMERTWWKCKVSLDKVCKVHIDYPVTNENFYMGITILPSDDFEYSFETLLLDKLQINFLPYGFAIKDFSNLLILHSGLFKINPEALKDLTGLVTVNFTGNKIVEVPDNSFSKMRNLTKLDLSHNLIEEIQDEAFTNLTMLEVLNMTNNQLSFMNQKIFIPLENLKILILSYNKLKSVPFNLLEPLKKLINVDFLKSGCVDVHANSIETPIQIIEREIAERCNPDITFTCNFDIDEEIPESASTCLAIDFKTVQPKTEIKTVNFDWNAEFEKPMKGLVIKDTTALFLPILSEKFPEIKKLVVENSQLEALYRYYFEGLVHLEHIEITKNKITYIEDGTFVEAEGVIYLDLSYNAITSFPERVFKGLTNLKTLIVSGNQIETFISDAFPSNSAIEILKLDNNVLKNVDSEILDFSESLKIVDLRKNVCIDEIYEKKDGGDEEEYLKELKAKIEGKCL